MSFSVASCCMFCPPVSYAFATLACWPIAIAPSSCSAAVPICRPWLCHPPALPGRLIVANTATAAPCAGWRSFLPSNFPLGCPTHLSPRTLHDHPLPARSPNLISTPLPLEPDQNCRYSIHPPQNPISHASPTALSQTSVLTIAAS